MKKPLEYGWYEEIVGDENRSNQPIYLAATHDGENVIIRLGALEGIGLARQATLSREEFRYFLTRGAELLARIELVDKRAEEKRSQEAKEAAA